MDNANISKPIEDIIPKIRQAIKNLPLLAGAEVVNFTWDNFKNQSFDGQPWRPRKNPTKWGQVPKGNNRPILIGYGGAARLKNSIRILRYDFENVVIGTDVPYAKAHNEGFSGTVVQNVGSYNRTSKKGTVSSVKEHSRRIQQNIPARPFLKDSPILQQRLANFMAAKITEHFPDLKT